MPRCPVHKLFTNEVLTVGVRCGILYTVKETPLQIRRQSYETRQIEFQSVFELVENGHVKVGRYEYTRNVDTQGNSHFYRTFRSKDMIIHDEIDPLLD